MDLSKSKGTIAYVLNQNKDELFGIINSERNLNKVKEQINNIIRNGDVKNQEDVDKAIEILNNCKNQSLYFSTLVTYMTGNKV